MEKRFVTVLECAIAAGAKQSETGGYTLGELERVGFPLFCGCVDCEASLHAGNAYPSQCGYTRCEACINSAGDGFSTPAAFTAWDRWQEEERKAAIDREATEQAQEEDECA